MGLMRRGLLILLSMGSLLVFVPVAAATPTVTFSPEITSGGLGGLGSINATLHISGTEYGGFPPPVVGIVLRLPRGTTLNAGNHSTCSKMTLEQTGPSGCPKASVAGPVDKATGIVSFGSERVEEEPFLESFFAPGGGLNFFINGHSPVSVEILASATVAGNVITIEVPLASTGPGAPYASLTEVVFRLGETQSEEEGSHLESGLTFPSECPTGKFAWAASVTFDREGSLPINAEPVESSAETGCPTARKGHAAEEAAAKKHQREEAELAALRAEVKRLQEELGAAVHIEKVKITTKGVLVTIKTSEPGIVTISGRGLKKTHKTLAAGTYHVNVALTKFGGMERTGGHKKTKLSVSLKVGKRSVSGSEKVSL